MGRHPIDREKIKEIIEENMRPGQLVSTDMAWKLCRHLGGYSTITAVFRNIVLELRKQGRVENVKHGTYKILRHN